MGVNYEHTKNDTARSANLREANTRETEWTYEEPNALDIPDPVINRFINEGLSLRWIRINLKGGDDYQNVGKKMAEGWTFVNPEEVQRWLFPLSCRGWAL